MNNTIKDKNMFNAEQYMSECDYEIKVLKETIANDDEEIKFLRDKLSQRNKQVADLKHRLEEKEDTLKELKEIINAFDLDGINDQEHLEALKIIVNK